MHTPFTIEEAFTNALRKLTEVETVVEITGFYNMKGKVLYSYNYRGFKEKFYYDELKDLKSVHKTTILTTEDKRALLTDGRSYKLRCLVKIRSDHSCQIQLLLIVEEVIDLELTIDPEKKETTLRKSEIIKVFRTENRQENVSLMLKTLIRKKKLPSIALVQPKINETLDDIKETLGEHLDKYNFKDFKVNIKNEQEIIRTIKKVDSERKFNLIAVFRGGGTIDDFEVFDTTTIGEVISELHTPFVIAVGHAGDEPFAQRVSDRSFSTPGDLGSYLKEIYVNSGKEDDLTERENELRDFQKELNEERVELKERRVDIDKRTEYLKYETISSEEKNKKLLLLEKELLSLGEKNKKLEQLSDINADKNKKLKSQLVSAILFSLLVTAGAIYFSTAYFFNDSKTPNIDTNVNSNMKTSSNVSNSNSKNKRL